MSELTVIDMNKQSHTVDQFLYFFLRLRKDRCRKVVKALKARYPDEPPKRLARRLITAQTQLSFLGGVLMHAPQALPGVGEALKLLGVAGGTSVLSRMHLYLILQIALVYGKDIDDQERVPEMLSVVATTGLAAGAPLALRMLEVHPLFAAPVGGLAASAAAQLIGQNAIRLYEGDLEPSTIGSTPEPAPAI